MGEIQRGTVAIVGGGNMGADVALVFAAGGWDAHVVEPAETVRAKLPHRCVHGAQQIGARGALDRLHAHARLEDAPWERIGLVVECVPEKLELKQSVFAQLERLARADCILTSNSSSFPISAIAEGMKTRNRMLGLHFFLPAHLVPLVEVIRSDATDAGLPEQLFELMRALGRVPVHVRRDIPGFLANRLQHALAREAFALIDAGVATPQDIDAAVRFGFGFRFLAAGPCLQRDHAGLDVHAAAAATMYPTLANDTEPARVLRDKVAAGQLGMKTGGGFYAWDEESIGKERLRYESLLLAGLELLKNERPRRG